MRVSIKKSGFLYKTEVFSEFVTFSIAATNGQNDLVDAALHKGIAEDSTNE